MPITYPPQGAVSFLSATLTAGQQFVLSGDISVTFATSQNDYNPSGWGTAAIARVGANTTGLAITGLQGGSDGRVAFIHNVSGNTFTLSSESASSSAANRFAFGGDLFLGPNHGVVLSYDSTSSRWRISGNTPQSANASSIWAASQYYSFASPNGMKDAMAFTSLTDAATVTWNVASQGFNATITLGGNRTIDAPTNVYDGLVLTLELVQDGTGSRVPSWNSMWDFGASGTPTLQTAASKRDIVTAIYRSANSKLNATFRKGA